MCRDINHAGSRTNLRCACDTSEARQARRVKARAHAEYSRGSGPSPEVMLVPSTAPAAPVASIERVKALRSELAELDKSREALPYHKDEAGNSVYEVNGENFTSLFEALRANEALIEQKTIEAGSVVSALAAERSGIGQSDMQDYWQSETARLKELLDGPTLPRTPEQEEELEAARQKIRDAAAALEAYEAEHIDDYPHETASGFFSRVAHHMRENPSDLEAYEKYWAHDKLVNAHHDAMVSKAQVETSHRSYLNDAEKRYRALNSQHGPIEEKLAEMMAKRAEAYREVLSEIREMGGAELKTVGSPRKGVGEVLRETMQYYPKDWIEASNRLAASRPLRIKSTAKRAHYSGGKAQVRRSSMKSVIVRPQLASWQPNPGYIHDQGAIIIKPQEGGGYTTYTASNGYVYEAWCDADEVLVVTPEYQVHHNFFGTNDKPSGSGWKQITTVRKTADGEEVEDKTWVRQKSKVISVEQTTEAEITISGGKGGFQGKAGFPVALHEFAHRVEHVGPTRIGRMEAAFLERRRKQSEAAGKSGELATIYKNTSEVGYEDEFADHYMGKIYEGSIYKELLSTGMESLFSGSFGGLMGTAGYRRDDDMQHLVLGLLATA